MNNILDSASCYVFSELERVDNDLARLSLPLQTAVMIYSAQGIIDNGGLRYFFESDFPNQPPYSSFSDAYHRIGAEEVSQIFEKTVALFPFDAPHLHETKRQNFLESLGKEGEFGEFKEFEHSLCDSQSIWKKLEIYIRQNREIFGID